MRTEITFGGYRGIFDSPEGVHLVGLTVNCGGMNFSIIDGLSIDGDSGVDETVVLDCGITLVFHYYSMPLLEPLMREFVPFNGMKFVEIHQMIGEDELYIVQTV